MNGRLRPSRELRSAAKWIHRNTTSSREHLTPEISLALASQTLTKENCPLPEPYWAVYWSGGQALTRYILDNAHLVRDKYVLDFGSGCGSATIAAVSSGAKNVFCNDIDQYALLAAVLNCRQNNTPMASIEFSQHNFLLPPPCGTSRIPDMVLLGDLFYDKNFAGDIIRLLQQWQRLKPKMDILVGDPDRMARKINLFRKIIGVKFEFEKELLIEYPLPNYWTCGHDRFVDSAKVYRLLFV